MMKHFTLKFKASETFDVLWFNYNNYNTLYINFILCRISKKANYKQLHIKLLKVPGMGRKTCWLDLITTIIISVEG